MLIVLQHLNDVLVYADSAAGLQCNKNRGLGLGLAPIHCSPAWEAGDQGYSFANTVYLF